MERKCQDWKDVAHSYYDKAFSLAILLILFAFLVSPDIEIKPYNRKVRITKDVYTPTEIKEKIIKQPDQMIKSQPQIDWDDQLSDDDDNDEELEFLDTIDKTTLAPYEEIIKPEGWGTTTKDFIFYNEPPKKLNEAPLRYPKFAKEAGTQGTVVLVLEVLKSGQVGAIEVKKSVLPGPGGLDQAAIEYARQLEFEPAKANGKAVAVWVTFPVNFYLEN